VPERTAVSASAWLPRPTRAALGLLALAVGVELFGRLLGSRGLSVVAAGLIGTVIAAALLTPRVSGVTVALRAPTRIAVGAESAVQLVVAAPPSRRWRSGPFLLTVASPAYGDATVMTPTVPAGGRAAVSYPVRPTRRGHWTGTNVTIETVSPLGGFVRRKNLIRRNEMWVYPPPAPPLPLPMSGSTLARAGSRTRVSPTGSEIAGLRQWQPGDPAARVHWRASARRNQLVVMERDDNQQQALLVALGRVETVDSFELAVARTAATALAALRSGHRVHLLTDHGAVALWTARDVMDRFAELSAAASPSAGSVAEALRRADVGAVVIWLSADPPSPEVDQAVRAAAATLVSAIPAVERGPLR
jgi:uncharacterized protein (DUF58 family)